MKNDIAAIVTLLICEGETLRIRDAILQLDSNEPDPLQAAIAELSSILAQTNLENHDLIGIHRFLLGCLHYERDQFERAIECFNTATQEMWNSPVNKSLAYRALGLCHVAVRNFREARRALQKALHSLETSVRINSPEAEREGNIRRILQMEVNDALERLSNEPLFRTFMPDPAENTDLFPVQDPPTDNEDDLPSVTLHIPISLTNENYPSNKIVFHAASSIPSEPEDETPQKTETRTDQLSYMTLSSQKIYGQKIRASRSGEPLSPDTTGKSAEIDRLILDGKPHSLHSLKPDKRITLSKGNEWGWMKVRGNSMNKMKKGTVSIRDGDYVLVERNSNSNHNDVVVACRLEEETDETFYFVKRFDAEKNMLRSESSIKGFETADIEITENIHIFGIVRAVAKPIAP